MFSHFVLSFSVSVAFIFASNIDACPSSVNKASTKDSIDKLTASSSTTASPSTLALKTNHQITNANSWSIASSSSPSTLLHQETTSMTTSSNKNPITVAQFLTTASTLAYKKSSLTEETVSKTLHQEKSSTTSIIGPGVFLQSSLSKALISVSNITTPIFATSFSSSSSSTKTGSIVSSSSTTVSTTSKTPTKAALQEAKRVKTMNTRRIISTYEKPSTPALQRFWLAVEDFSTSTPKTSPIIIGASALNEPRGTISAAIVRQIIVTASSETMTPSTITTATSTSSTLQKETALNSTAPAVIVSSSLATKNTSAISSGLLLGAKQWSRTMYTRRSRITFTRRRTTSTAAVRTFWVASTPAQEYANAGAICQASGGDLAEILSDTAFKLAAEAIVEDVTSAHKRSVWIALKWDGENWIWPKSGLIESGISQQWGRYRGEAYPFKPFNINGCCSLISSHKNNATDGFYNGPCNVGNLYPLCMSRHYLTNNDLLGFKNKH